METQKPGDGKVETTCMGDDTYRYRNGPQTIQENVHVSVSVW